MKVQVFYKFATEEGHVRVASRVVEAKDLEEARPVFLKLMESVSCVITRVAPWGVTGGSKVGAKG